MREDGKCNEKLGGKNQQESEAERPHKHVAAAFLVYYPEDWCEPVFPLKDIHRVHIKSVVIFDSF